ncbi:hypothetical protein L210DRAFT_3645373 [Boletus edulis BED1]|uniref:Transposase n=1 Tax=Boletus edulis BED1 TaxID=1328754 RepID=A0AAD4BVD5_BOLED|nr:hypothetical protein L210DRAFT_3645373 [Boletus edulis BED1]
MDICSGMVKVTHVDECIVMYDETDNRKDPTSGFITWWGIEGKIIQDQGKRPRVVGVSLKNSWEWTPKTIPFPRDGRAQADVSSIGELLGSPSLETEQG